MSSVEAAHLGAAALGLVVGGIGGLGVRPLIARVPEPVPEPEPEPEPEPDSEAEPDQEPQAEPDPAEPSPPKELYADIAARPGLTRNAVVVGALAGAVIGVSIGWSWSLLLVLPLIPVSVALAVIDARTRLLPTRLVLPATAVAIVLGTVVSALADDWHALVRAGIALVVVRSVFWLIWFIRSSGMGFGDVRLSAMLGFVLGHLGWAQVVVGIYAAFLEFVIPGLLLALVHRDKERLKARLPFGPFLLLGAVTGIAFGPAIATALGY